VTVTNKRQANNGVNQHQAQSGMAASRRRQRSVMKSAAKTRIGGVSVNINISWHGSIRNE